VVAAILVFVAIPRHEIWLGVPEELRGAVVYVGSKQVAVISEPDLTLIKLWRNTHELRIEKAGYLPIVLTVNSRGKSYLVVEKTSLKHAGLNASGVRRMA
jgi:hypothetical protein